MHRELAAQPPAVGAAAACGTTSRAHARRTSPRPLAIASPRPRSCMLLLLRWLLHRSSDLRAAAEAAEASASKLPRHRPGCCGCGSDVPSSMKAQAGRRRRQGRVLALRHSLFRGSRVPHKRSAQRCRGEREGTIAVTAEPPLDRAQLLGPQRARQRHTAAAPRLRAVR
ncbi:hypothetical protein FA09DRAFT_21923 [Tilletiopsis washingtonensis]|uniref:Uncharacterized protein n=1 Tax=Tilletiopsis washingtonensis TaxID=58919 RepID=A0A316Z8V3_9BASI|nr:hypothetical protein FA09DRAFT_21923 [Tilletiopsis washingtonensis]PWN98217.1 hypothetical protein FA09DRAFT_21923 [Tilletiopsis washingtonensis]